jgi:hypothetical protein
MQLNFERKILVCGLFIATLAGSTIAINQILLENGDSAWAQTRENQTSIPHDAKGHETHQVIVFQNPSDSITYTGVVTFNLSKPADVIAFEDITGKDTTNATKKIWEVGVKKFVPNTLLKNVTEGSVSFNGSGILAHSTLSNVYTGSYTLNETASNNTSSNP